ncbi:Uncharacterised protein [Bifidobacterium adolescentis]|uniref:Uncharacterized protein n=1 Tax=Bifidobacterium adolescentis TaxID=1680 RepID=A0A6N2UHX0_BIFAD
MMIWLSSKYLAEMPFARGWSLLTILKIELRGGFCGS